MQGLFVAFTVAAVPASADNLIYWSPGAKLQFADFMGKRSRGDHSYVGKTASTIVPKIKYTSDSVYYKVDCVFQKDNSVIIGRSRSVLEHEQGHFDITEIVARQIRKNLSALSAAAVNAASVNNIVAEAYRQGREIQEAYEADCGYGDVPGRQEAWNRRIAEMLDALKGYEQPERVVKLN